MHTCMYWYTTWWMSPNALTLRAHTMTCRALCLMSLYRAVYNPTPPPFLPLIFIRRKGSVWNSGRGPFHLQENRVQRVWYIYFFLVCAVKELVLHFKKRHKSDIFFVLWLQKWKRHLFWIKTRKLSYIWTWNGWRQVFLLETTVFFLNKSPINNLVRGFSK